jgi:ABC-type lipoprotein release transport system permease subunit
VIFPFAWRNLWRNPRRTWLTAGAIAFAVLLLGFFMSTQIAQYATMIDTGTSLLMGHLQVQPEKYVDDPKLERTIAGAAALRERIAALPGVVAASRRAQTFALASAGERSFAAQVMGVEPDRERHVVRFPQLVRAGRYLLKGDEAVLGAALARNLGLHVGDELTLLGTARSGFVAALGLTVVGIVETESAELDRSIVQVPYDVFADAFDLGDRANVIVVAGDDPDAASAIVPAVAKAAGAPLRVLDWRELMPEIEQAIDLDRTSGTFLYGVVVVLVTFSVVNTFVMTVFERTREVGMLIALGMRPNALVGLLQLEALGLVSIGIAIGGCLAVALIGWVARVGMPLPEAAMELLQEMHLPSRMYPVLSPASAGTAPLIMLIAVQLAALIPSLRIRRLVPVVALRAA